MAGRPPIGAVAMTGAERQRRYWATHRPDPKPPKVLTGTAAEIAENIFQELGKTKAARVASALQKRIKAIDPKCSLCGGTGLALATQASTPCGGVPLFQAKMPCPCDGSRWAR